MRFAGHPTIGTAYVMVEEGRVEAQQFSLQEEVGPVPVRVEHGPRARLWLSTPAIEEGPTYDPSQCAAGVLGLERADLLEVVSGGLDPRDFGGATRFSGNAAFSGDHGVVRTGDRRDWCRGCPRSSCPVVDSSDG